MKQYITRLTIVGLIATNIATFAFYHDLTNEIEEAMLEMKQEQKSLSNEIANLEGDIDLKDNQLKKQKKAINKQDKAIKEQELKLEQQQEKIEKQKKKIDSQEKKIKKQKQALSAKAELKKQQKLLQNKKKNEAQFVKASSEKKIVSRSSNENYRTVSAVATAYIALCDTGCTGITRTGIDVRNYPSKRIVAVDPNVIPLHSKVKVTLPSGEQFYAVAEDTGGDIKGNRIDILMSTRNEAVNFGRQNVKVEVLKEG